MDFPGREILSEYARILKENGASSNEGWFYELKYSNQIIKNEPASKWFQVIRIFVRIEELRLEERLEKPWEVDSEFWKESKDPYGSGSPWWEDEFKDSDTDL